MYSAPAVSPAVNRRAVMRSVAHRDIPIALAITGVVVLVIGGVNFVTLGAYDAVEYVPDMIVAAVLLGASVVLRRDGVSGVLVQWAYAAAMVLVVAWLLNEFRTQPDTANMAYVVIVMATFGPVVLAWRPFLAAALSMTVGAVAVLVSIGWGDARGWSSAYVVAVAVGAAFLQIRMRSLAELADARATIESLATTDSLTGLLNRHGLDVFTPGLVASATRLGQPLVVWFIDIDGLKGVNDRFGHDVGDEVIRAVGDAVRACAREGDLVARWGGDEFLVLGMGIEPHGDTPAQRIDARIRAAGVATDRWCGTVSTGTASRMPQTTTLEDLISEADARMYRGRSRR
jgi:diguanylate cyclase (GGDEF)-like protein